MVKFLKRIAENVRQFNTSRKANNIFTFPYSTDEIEKRKQVWENLQKGILLEDKGILIRWGTPYYELDQLKEAKKFRADRTEWFLGKRTILAGYESNLEVLKWMWKEQNAVIKIDENLGFDEEGERKFNYLKTYLTDLLGKPSKMDIQKFGALDIGEIHWEYGIVSVYIIGIEHFNCRYSLHIGLTTNHI
ncbi:MAG TPA: hypothetical protein VGN20_05390 [Mucilaginibacter sp.]|jgi:hypothetical protein